MITTPTEWDVTTDDGKWLGTIQRRFNFLPYTVFALCTDIGKVNTWEEALALLESHSKAHPRARIDIELDPLQDLVETRAMPMYEESRLTGGVMIWEQE